MIAVRSPYGEVSVSYTHLRAHETVLDLVCRLLLEKKKKQRHNLQFTLHIQRDNTIVHEYVRMHLTYS